MATPVHRHDAVFAQSNAITPRSLGLDYSADTPVHWFAGNPFLTHFMNAFSGILPPGERFMIASVRARREQARGHDRLQNEISGFIGQEAYHASEHRKVNEMLQARGLPMDKLEAFSEWVVARLNALPDSQRMAITGATEHLTAIFGNLVLKHPEVVEQVHLTLRPVFVWHALEELEHKAVAYDLYQAVDGSYRRRVLGLLLITAAITAQILYGQLLFMRKDGTLFDLRSTAQGLWWMFGIGKRAGYLRRGIREYLDFFRPSFHPSQDDSRELIDQWRQHLSEIIASRGRARARARDQAC